MPDADALSVHASKTRLTGAEDAELNKESNDKVAEPSDLGRPLEHLSEGYGGERNDHAENKLDDNKTREKSLRYHLSEDVDRFFRLIYAVNEIEELK